MEKMPEELARLREVIERMPVNNTCFVIAPIGESGSEVRRRSDQILKHLIHPAAQACGLEAVRADHISEQGVITHQVIGHILEDRMVVADLTGHNPNVFYELAVRHAIRRPYVQIMEKGEKIPFDIASVRTIYLDHRDLDSVEAARSELVRAIHSMPADGEVDSPISAAVGLTMLRNTRDFLNGLTDVKNALESIREKL